MTNEEHAKLLLAKLHAHDVAGEKHAASSDFVGGTFHSEMRELVVENYIKEVRQQTIEECAKVCDTVAEDAPYDYGDYVYEASEAIRKLKG